MIPRSLSEDLQAPGDIEEGRGRDGGEGGKRRGGRREKEREREREGEMEGKKAEEDTW